MTRTLLAAALLAAACGPRAVAPAPPRSSPPSAAVAADHAKAVVAAFEPAVISGPAAYAELFDFAAVGKVEKLLHRYDALGRSALPDDWRASFLAEDATPFSVERERTNLGKFFWALAAPRVGTGACRVVEPASDYVRQLAEPFEPLPPGHEAFEPLRVEVNAIFARGGVVSLACAGGRGQLALVYAADDSPRGWSLVTMYDDVVPGDAPAPNPCGPQ